MSAVFDDAMARFAPELPLAVGFSGGADSTALLAACARRWPGQVLAVHVHHGLQAAADDFERHCADLCRRLGVPARYVSGYLRNDDPELHVGRTSHSWAEAWVPGLEWVGFDPANDISPRGDSLRVAVGLDYRDAAPVSGRRVGFGDARMTAEASVTLVDP